MEKVNPYILDVEYKLNALKEVIDQYIFYSYTGEGFNKFIYAYMGTYQLYIGYISGIGYKPYLMSGKEIISDINPVESIEEVLDIINTVEQFRDNYKVCELYGL